MAQQKRKDRESKVEVQNNQHSICKRTALGGKEGNEQVQESSVIRAIQEDWKHHQTPTDLLPRESTRSSVGVWWTVHWRDGQTAENKNKGTSSWHEVCQNRRKYIGWMQLSIRMKELEGCLNIRRGRELAKQTCNIKFRKPIFKSDEGTLGESYEIVKEDRRRKRNKEK